MTAEKAIFGPPAAGGVTITETLGYAPGSEVPVFSKTYTTVGTFSDANIAPTPGDAAALARFSTAARTSKNHPLYLFNYWHTPFFNVTTTAADTLLSTQRTAMSTYASAWITGFSDGTVTHHRSGPNGDDATGSLISTEITHRDLPR